MRLLKVDENGELVLTEDVSEPDPYAILSHTWGKEDEEVTFDDLKRNRAKSKAGYAKLLFCAIQARGDGLKYFWVDTCCINRANLSELSEAINSMFRWYKEAARCYVHLSDVSVYTNVRQSTARSWERAFKDSRWFQRGWTLQELLAPAVVGFFSVEGQRLGDKRSLEAFISEISGIPPAALQGLPLASFPVDERLKWAKGRRTKKIEDQAYCLLGIFGVFMPLIYGEGNHAHIRLRSEIAKAAERVPNDAVLSLEYRPRSSDTLVNSSNDRDTASGTDRVKEPQDRVLKNAVISPGYRQHRKKFHHAPDSSSSDDDNTQLLDVRPPDCAIATRSNKVDTELHTAVRQNSLDKAKDLVANDPAVDVNAADGEGRTPFWNACFEGHLPMVEYLHERSADIHLANKYGYTPLAAAAYEGHLDVVRYLLTHGADVDLHTTANFAQTPFFGACRSGHAHVAQTLFEHGADIDIHTPDAEGCTPLGAAAYYGHLGVVKYLLANGARTDMDVTYKDGVSPIYAASGMGQLAVVQHLYEQGANIYLTKDGRTPRHEAVRCGHLEVVKYFDELLQKGRPVGSKYAT